jgi:N-acetylmuramic acid 6-phosphate etherase
MATESVSDRYRGLDVWDTDGILEALVEGQMAAVAAVRPALPQLGRAAESAVPRLRAGGRLIYVGAGTSGRIAVQDGVELTPTFDWPPERVRYALAGGDAALIRSIEGAEDDRAKAVADLNALRPSRDDVVIGVAASGTTPYTLASLARAREAGALTIGLANNPGAPLLAEVEHPILLDTGPEAVAGSTRMKAGTAQKTALNLLSTLIMVRLGRVHDGLMVDVRATNAKLVARSRRMLMQIAGCDEATAAAALRRCDGRAKPAVLVVRGLSPREADEALERSGGSLRAALAAVGR